MKAKHKTSLYLTGLTVALFFCALAALLLWPGGVRAAGENGDITIDLSTDEGSLYIWNDGYMRGDMPDPSRRTLYSGSYTLKGTTTDNIVTVMLGYKAGTRTITLSSLLVASDQNAAFQIQPDASVNLMLTGDSTLTSVQGPGLGVPENAALTINGEGSLTAESTASQSGSAGIGGGKDQTGGSITINGGTITASSNSGAGIGGGNRGAGANVTIDGGSVNATSRNGLGIDAPPKNSAGTPVVRYTLTVPGADEQPIEHLVVGSYTGADTPDPANQVYGIHGVQTDSGKLYLYLPNSAVAAKNQTELWFKAPETWYSGEVDAGTKTVTLKAFSGEIYMNSIDMSNLYIWNEWYGRGATEGEASNNQKPWTGNYTLKGERSKIQNMAVTVMDDYTGKGRSITLEYLWLEPADPVAGSAFRIKPGASVNLNLARKNNLKSNKGPGLQVPKGAAVSIGGDGALYAETNDVDSAGIGGGQGEDGGTITIEGGTITATGGTQAVDIGGGRGQAGADVTIDGGSIKAGRIDSAPKNSSGDAVFLNTLTVGVGTVGEGTEIRGLRDPTKLSNGYGVNGVVTMDDDKLYFYLPATTAPGSNPAIELIAATAPTIYSRHYPREAKAYTATLLPPAVYTITIPETVDFQSVTYKPVGSKDQYQDHTFFLNPSGVFNLIDGRTLSVTVSGSGTGNAFAMSASGAELPYSVYRGSVGDDEQLQPGQALARGWVSGTTDPQKCTLRLDQSKIANSGKYTGTLTFTININDTKE